MVGIEDFVAVHDCHEVFIVGEVDDVVSVAGEHDDGLDLVAVHFIFEDFIGAFLSHLNQTVTLDDDELFPLGIMPVLSFCNTGFRDIDADMTAVGSAYKFCERTAIINIHLQIEDGFFCRQVA